MVVPNQKLSQAILTNFHLPIASVTMTVALTVGADADADAVEKALRTRSWPARSPRSPICASGKPLVRLADITDAGQVWNCTFDVKDVEAQGLAGHEVRKRLLARLRRDGLRWR